MPCTTPMHDPFADFTTAPEISQAFGEVLGAWAAITWEGDGPSGQGDIGRGRPRPWHADGGRPAADRRRRSLLISRAALRLHLVETSPRAFVPSQASRAARMQPGMIGSRICRSQPMILLGKRVPGCAADPSIRPARPIAGPNGYVDAGQPSWNSPARRSWQCDVPDGCVFEERDPALARHLGDRLRSGDARSCPVSGLRSPWRADPATACRLCAMGSPTDPLAEAGQLLI